MNKVIDTNIWRYGFLHDEEYRMDCANFLYAFIMNRQDSMAMDAGGKMLSEYNRNLRQDPEFRKTFVQLQRDNRISHVVSRIPMRHKERLRALGFHEEEDHVFLGTALQADRYLVSEDSDYGTRGQKEKQQANQYMRETLGIMLRNSEEALEDIRGIEGGA
ncbi:MAG: PIN domain-containing protein [Eubacteriales bacterium]|nr:PIN domain-containing protein [Eubacteriales bacterium]